MPLQDFEDYLLKIENASTKIMACP